MLCFLFDTMSCFVFDAMSCFVFDTMSCFGGMNVVAPLMVSMAVHIVFAAGV